MAGALDEVRVWDHARTPEEIADAMSKTLVMGEGLVARWALDGDDAALSRVGAELSDDHVVLDQGAAPIVGAFSPEDGAAVGVDAELALDLEMATAHPVDVTYHVRELTSQDDFTIVVMPDTQIYTLEGRNLERYFNDQTKWIRAHRADYNIVGVMPKGYAFSVAQSFWVPLRLDVSGYARRQGPDIRVFARLAPGSSMSEARAELTALGRRASADFRDTHEHLRPRIMPYTKSIVNITGWRSAGVMSVNLPLVMLLMLICGNVALLLFARAATRESEIIVRTALGAGRGRIVMQLFTEALVLGGVRRVQTRFFAAV
jgi:hypothetical protein